MIGIDTNILVAHAIPEHPHHGKVREILTLNPGDFQVFGVFQIHVP